jgi:tight adherence protein B
VTGLVLACCAAIGTYLIVTAERGTDGGLRRAGRAAARWARLRLRQAGLLDVSVAQFAGASVGVGLLAGAVVATMIGPGLPAVVVAAVSACVPAAYWRRQRRRRQRVASDSWPRLIEELRVLTGSLGRSIPQALLEAGLRGPEEMRPAFLAAQREWALSTDVAPMVAVLKQQLADPTADATCETLLVAAEVGGDLDARLAALAADRRQDVADRRDAEAKMAGARLARTFVVLVPLGMAIAGMGVGDGRAAYSTGQGQVLVAAGVLLVVACWWWAGRVMHLPTPERVFDR